MRERLLAANPESGQALRDVTLSLDRLGDLLANRGHAEDGEEALRHYERSLGLRERLLEANPQSGEAMHDVSISQFKLTQFHSARGAHDTARHHGKACLAILESFVREGRPMDAQTRDLHAKLKPLFSEPE